MRQKVGWGGGDEGDEGDDGDDGGGAWQVETMVYEPFAMHREETLLDMVWQDFTA